MRDYTLEIYKYYLSIFQSYLPFYRFDEFLEENQSLKKFCLIRHDVDRKPTNALKMAHLEHEMGIVSTYYFRIKKNTFIPAIIKEIESLGHEIGYHYECLSDENGNVEKALELFKNDLSKFRSIANVKTISMHGRPLKPYDNRDIWRNASNYNILQKELKILGEIYLEIDYRDIAYINDTGRNWTSSKSNRRDKVNSDIECNFENNTELIDAIKSERFQKVVFQIHPERWSYNSVEYYSQKFKDEAINLIKTFIR